MEATYRFIILMIGSTCFELCYTHHQELTTIMLITTWAVRFLGLLLVGFILQLSQRCTVEYILNKAVPLQVQKSPEGSRKLSFPDFVKTSQDGGKVVSLTNRSPLPPSTHFR